MSIGYWNAFVLSGHLLAFTRMLEAQIIFVSRYYSPTLDLAPGIGGKCCYSHLGIPFWKCSKSHLLCLALLSINEEQPRELVLFRLDKRRLRGDLIPLYNCLKGGSEVGPVYSAVPAVRGSQDMALSWDRGDSGFTLWVARYWNRLPRSLEVFKKHLNPVLDDVG